MEYVQRRAAQSLTQFLRAQIVLQQLCPRKSHAVAHIFHTLCTQTHSTFLQSVVHNMPMNTEHTCICCSGNLSCDCPKTNMLHHQCCSSCGSRLCSCIKYLIVQCISIWSTISNITSDCNRMGINGHFPKYDVTRGSKSVSSLGLGW